MDIDRIISNIQPVRKDFSDLARTRLDNLTKPPGSLGRLEEFAMRIVGITEQPMPLLDKKVIFTFAGDHGVTAEGVSAYPAEVTRQMVINFMRGGAAINILAQHAGAEVVVIDIGMKHTCENDFHTTDRGGTLMFRKVLPGTGNIRKGPAMTHRQAAQCLEEGAGLAAEYRRKGYRFFGTGEMGIGNTTPSSAIAAVLTGMPVSEVTGRGTGITDEMLRNKISVIEDAIVLNRPNPSDPLDVLAKVGGAEIGGIAGLIIGAAAEKVPVVIDGFIATAGALIAYCLEPRTKDYMFAAHISVEKGHKAMLETIGLQPVLDLDLRLGEGTGAALAMLIIEAGLKIYRGMATFSEAGVSSSDRREESIELLK